MRKRETVNYKATSAQNLNQFGSCIICVCVCVHECVHVCVCIYIYKVILFFFFFYKHCWCHCSYLCSLCSYLRPLQATQNIFVIRVNQLLHSQGLCPAVYNHIRGQQNHKIRNNLWMFGIINMKLNYNSEELFAVRNINHVFSTVL